MSTLSLRPESPAAIARYGETGNCAGNIFRYSTLHSRERKTVCVTSVNSYFGAHLARKLLAGGYLVRATIQHPSTFEDVKEFMTEEEISLLESVVVAKMGDVDSLCNAFGGCHAVFHTSSFIDPRGVSGYTERMAFLEAEGARNVVEAIGRTAYVKRCVFTSSLLAAIWVGEETAVSGKATINESCWSDEDFCRENKLWLALGKTRAEKAAWKRSREVKVNLVTICPALLMTPSFPDACIETAIPYLKGGQSMLRQGVLGVEDVNRAVEAHVAVYEDMDYGACGRYICCDKILTRLEDVILLENRLKMRGFLSHSETFVREIHARLCNNKITKLLARTSRRISCKHYLI